MVAAGADVAAVVDVAVGAFGNPPYSAGLHLSTCPPHACTGPGSLDCHSDSSGSSHPHKSPCSCPHNLCIHAADFPKVEAPCNAPLIHTHDGGCHPHVAGLVGEPEEGMCLGGVGTGPGDGGSEVLYGVDSLMGVTCAWWVVAARCWVEGRGEGWVECLGVVTCWSGGDEVGGWEEVGGVQFQCGDGGAVVVGGGEMMMMMVMTVDGVVAGAVCGGAGDSCWVMGVVADLLVARCVVEASAGVTDHPVVDRGGAGVLHCGGGAHSADEPHPAGTLGLCLGGVGAQ